MTETLSALLQEGRTFPPPPGFTKDALITDATVYDDAERDWHGFWARQALALDWHREWDTILEWELPFAKWFVGGKLNVSENCLDRHVKAGHGSQVALHWEGEPGDSRAVTYQELLDETSRVANLLRELGVVKGDRVAIYMGMVPETVAAMLACARIGAAHSVVFGGFTAQSLKDRINDAQARVLITADGAWRRGSVVALKEIADEAIADTPSIEHVVVLRRTENRRARCRPAATSGGTTRSPASRPSARRSRWTPRTCFTSSTRRAPPGGPRASCTRPAVTSRRSRTRTSTSST